MNITITQLELASPEIWDLIWQNCDYSTYFHSREWAEVWQEYTDHKYTPYPLLVTFSDGKRLLFPFSKYPVHRGLNTAFTSSPAGTYGGWLSQDTLSEHHIAALIATLKKQGYNLMWRSNPYAPRLSVDNSLDMEVDTNHVLFLNANFNDAWSKAYRTIDRKARKAEQEGVMIRQAETQDDWDSYYGIYEKSLERWGEAVTSFYEKKLFDMLYGRRSPNIRLWLAEYQQTIIGGALCFYAPKHVVYWHGAALAEFFHLRGVNLLMHTAIQDAYHSGYGMFDFNPSGGHEGVAAFKKSFGATELPCPVYEYTTWRYKLLRQIIRRLRN